MKRDNRLGLPVLRHYERTARTHMNGSSEGGVTNGSQSSHNPDQRIDRRRRTGRNDARPGSCVARHRCRRRRAASGECRTEREVRPDFGPLHGSLSPPRGRRQVARRRPSRRLPERHSLGHERARNGTLARPHPGARRAGNGRCDGAGYAVGHAGTHSPRQPEVLRAGAVRAPGGAIASAHSQSR